MNMKAWEKIFKDVSTNKNSKYCKTKDELWAVHCYFKWLHKEERQNLARKYKIARKNSA